METKVSCFSTRQLFAAKTSRSVIGAEYRPITLLKAAADQIVAVKIANTMPAGQ
jgi:hypothetical protein